MVRALGAGVKLVGNGDGDELDCDVEGMDVDSNAGWRWEAFRLVAWRGILKGRGTTSKE